MSAPAAVNHGAALDQLARALVRVLESAAARQHAAPDSAGHCRSPRAGAQSAIQHEDHDARPDQEMGIAVFEGDSHREPTKTGHV